MSLMTRVRYIVPAIILATGCAKGQEGGPDGGGSGPDAPTCGELCDEDGDGVLDGTDECPGTPAGEVVNQVGCADSQVMPTLAPMFPPYGLTWTPTGDLGRAGGLTWTYTGIDRADMFHIYWVVCDDPATPCGLSLDGVIDALEAWHFAPGASDLPAGKVVFTSSTHIVLQDTTIVPLTGRLTVTIVDASGAAIPFAPLVSFPVNGRDGQYGAEIPGTGFTVVVLAEVQDTTAVWTPYLDYYDAAPTADPGLGTAASFGGSFYDE